VAEGYGIDRDVYGYTKRFPPSEIYALSSQLTRAVASVPANIAEGNGRGAVRDYARFLGIAKGSPMETETYLQIAAKLDYLVERDIQEAFGLIIEISKMLTAMRAKLAP
jgi:four helix bundle protein